MVVGIGRESGWQRLFSTGSAVVLVGNGRSPASSRPACTPAPHRQPALRTRPHPARIPLQRSPTAIALCIPPPATPPCPSAATPVKAITVAVGHTSPAHTTAKTQHSPPPLTISMSTYRDATQPRPPREHWYQAAPAVCEEIVKTASVYEKMVALPKRRTAPQKRLHPTKTPRCVNGHIPRTVICDRLRECVS